MRRCPAREGHLAIQVKIPCKQNLFIRPALIPWLLKQIKEYINERSKGCALEKKKKTEKKKKHRESQPIQVRSPSLSVPFGHCFNRSVFSQADQSVKTQRLGGRRPRQRIWVLPLRNGGSRVTFECTPSLTVAVFFPDRLSVWLFGHFFRPIPRVPVHPLDG